MRLIDADALLKNYGLKDATKYGDDGYLNRESIRTLMLYEIRGMIEDAPTIEPIKKLGRAVIDKSTVKFAMSVLDSQWEYMMDCDRRGSKYTKEQSAYYDGQLRMAEIFVSQAFVGQIGISTPSSSGRDGKHCVLYANGKKLFADDET